MADPSEVLPRADLWAAALRERGLVDDAAAMRLNETLAESRGERLDREDDPLLVVMLCGPTAVGKSSLINALAGADISPRGLGATTGGAVLYVHERDDPERLFAYSQTLGRSGRQETVLVRHGRDQLLHKVLVDTPDIDSVMLQHEATTAGLVHAADLVLFVTSPEKYKVLRSARWVLEQRQQRAIAFVLNKWDREALGLQRDRRHEVMEDFRHVLAGEGYQEALVFKVSALTQPSDGAGWENVENELPALRAWLETGITQSTAAGIQQRRLRAAWGRLAAAIESVVPSPLSNNFLLPELFERLASRGATAAQSVSLEASGLGLNGLDDNGWPDTPGLLGMWTRTCHHVASTMASLRTAVSAFNTAARSGDVTEGRLNGPDRGDTFGAAATAGLSDAVLQLVGEASAAQLLLGPVAAAWTAEILRLERQLAVLPLDAVTALAAEARRPSLRRWAGTASVYAVEGLIVLVLLIAVGRVGIAFVAGSDAPNGLFTTALELIFALLIIGHGTATMFFPPLRQRVRRYVAHRARTLARAAVERAQTALREHVAAVDRLAHEGGELLRLIDRTVSGLTAKPRDGEDVDRLFGVQKQRQQPRMGGETPRMPLPPVARSEVAVQRHPFGPCARTNAASSSQGPPD
jgi:energy-coupling factor transporter ATP-binding protein EcfA2